MVSCGAAPEARAPVSAGHFGLARRYRWRFKRRKVVQDLLPPYGSRSSGFRRLKVFTRP